MARSVNGVLKSGSHPLLAWWGINNFLYNSWETDSFLLSNSKVLGKESQQLRGMTRIYANNGKCGAYAAENKRKSWA